MLQYKDSKWGNESAMIVRGGSQAHRPLAVPWGSSETVCSVHESSSEHHTSPVHRAPLHIHPVLSLAFFVIEIKRTFPWMRERDTEREKNVWSVPKVLVVDFRGRVGASGLDNLDFWPGFFLFLNIALTHVDHHARSGLCSRVQLVLLT